MIDQIRDSAAAITALSIIGAALVGAAAWFGQTVIRDGKAVRDVLLGRQASRSRVTGEITPELEGVGVRVGKLEAQGEANTGLLARLVELVGENHEQRIRALERHLEVCPPPAPQTVVNVTAVPEPLS